MKFPVPSTAGLHKLTCRGLASFANLGGSTDKQDRARGRYWSRWPCALHRGATSPTRNPWATIFASCFLVMPRASRALSSRSTVTVGSAASIFARRDWLVPRSFASSTWVMSCRSRSALRLAASASFSSMKRDASTGRGIRRRSGVHHSAPGCERLLLPAIHGSPLLGSQDLTSPRRCTSSTRCDILCAYRIGGHA